MVASDLVTVERDGALATVTLNRPDKRNILSLDLVRELKAAYAELEADQEVRTAVLTGAGKAFCAGAELSTLEASASGDFDSVREVYDGFLCVLNSPVVTIGAINGPAVGAGFNLALACDVRVAGRSAIFDARFADLRLHPGGGHTWLLTRAVGEQAAMMACLFSEVWSAGEAQRNRLVTSVHNDADVVGVAQALAHRLDGQSTAFTRRLTETIRRSAVTARHDEALDYELDAQMWSAQQPEFLAGVVEIRRRIDAKRS